MVEDNNLFGVFDLVGIAPALRGATQIEVAFEVDKYGISLYGQFILEYSETHDIGVVWVAR